MLLGDCLDFLLPYFSVCEMEILSDLRHVVKGNERFDVPGPQDIL